MVGAGMSLNAEPTPGSRIPFPTWERLAAAMFDEIYPNSDDHDESRIRGKRFSNTSPLRIASEYEAAFGPAALASFIGNHIPDTDHQPGPLHRLLLQLPWRDVFTTNYDTLLERTEVTERIYKPVTTTSDLTRSDAPRIVKLHGSLPSHTPFIITEEHYRTYPTCYAPFVNTVRQSLIENSLVLVGFSGDDPNFLEWTGWIRDELGGHHAPIYLVGGLSLNNVQRSLLDQRGVTPIDLASGCRDDCQAEALKSFLECLISARPQRPEKWPERKTTSERTDSHGKPHSVDGSTPEQISGSGNSDLYDTVTRGWMSERLEYPGWLVPTAEMRASLWLLTSMEAWQFMERTRSYDAAVAIHMLRELNWRLETSMIPIFDDYRERFETVVDELFPARNDGYEDGVPDTLASDSKLAESWMEVAMALLRNARENYDEERWTVLNDRIDALISTCPEFADRYRYEQALWKTWNLDMDGARAVTRDWAPSHRKPLARMWRAGLLAELGQLTEARALLRDVLSDIRRSILSTQGQRIDILSLEGWCTYLLFTIDNPGWPRFNDEFSERWQELKAWDCSPLPVVAYFQNVLTDSPPARPERHKIVHDFDPGRITETYTLGDADTVAPWLPAFAYIRLFEQVGMPIRISGRNIIDRTLENACRWTISLTDFWSPALLIRAGMTEGLRKRHFTDRMQVAAMDIGLARRLISWATDALERQVPSIIKRRVATGISSLSLVESLVEVLSRLTIRMLSPELQRTFEIALSLYQVPEVFRHITLSRTCETWFSRLFGSADARQIGDWMPELLKFPLSAQRDASVIPWLDPMSGFPRDRADIMPNDDSRAEIEKSIDWLLRRSSSESREGWQRAMKRLGIVHYAGYMSKTQEEWFARVLWEGVQEDGLPDIPDYSSSNYWTLPHPPDVDVISRIRRRLLNSPIERMVSVSSSSVSVSANPNWSLVELALVSKPLIEVGDERQGMVAWTDDEATALWRSVLEWWDNERHGLSTGLDDLADNQLIRNFRCLGVLIQRLLPRLDLLNSKVWVGVQSILDDTRRHQIYLTTVWPYVLVQRKDEMERLTNMIMEDIESDSSDAVEECARAIRHWVLLASKEFVEKPGSEMVDMLVSRVAFRSPDEGIQQCIEQLSYLIVDAPDSVRESQVNLLVSALPAWQAATRLPRRKGEQGGFAEDERRALRVRIGELASALSGRFRGQAEPSEISRLRESYSTDSLPEVRRAFDRWKWVTPAT